MSQTPRRRQEPDTKEEAGVGGKSVLRGNNGGAANTRDWDG